MLSIPVMQTWPVSAFAPKSLLWRRSSVANSGGVSAGGLQRFAVTDGGGKWLCSMAADLWTLDKLLAAGVMEDLADGGAAIFVVPYWPFGSTPYPLGAAPEDVGHEDGSSFSDGSDYVSSGVEITLAADAGLRATQVTVTRTLCGPLKGGEVFSIAHNPPQGYDTGKRLYRVVGIDGDTLTIRPPLRAAAPAGTSLDFSTPGCTMRLINSEDFMDAMTAPIMSAMAPQFQEAF